jgi:anionic cell wall polymer biosynthesis LytR-Cps2A-Psr (LCP) family protein
MSTAETAAPYEDTGTAPPRRRGLRRLLLSLGVLGVVLALLMGGSLWFLTDRYASNVDRVSDVFTDLDGSARPAPATPAEQAGGEPVTFLLVGSDTRATAGEAIAAGGRSDAIMIARFSADRQHAQLITVPRDSWVDLPGHGTGKVNAAYGYGGPTLLI